MVMAVTVAGCAAIVIPVGPPNQEAWLAHLGKLRRLHQWQLSGRIGVVAGQHGGSANILWKQDKVKLLLSLSGPFGVDRVQLSGTPSRIVLRNSKGQTWVTRRPELALKRSLGWPVPLANLQYWIVGRPDPKSKFRIKLGSHGLVRTLQQGRWTVRYGAYVHTHNLWLPQKITATAIHVRVRLIISQWTLRATNG